MEESKPKFWSKKNTAFVEKWSKHQIEENQNFQVCYMELDVQKSKVNVYGEITEKRFTSVNGVNISGVISVTAEGREHEHGISKQTTILNFGCYVKTLRELNINPQIGDYFVVKNKWYVIGEKTPIDDNAVTVAFDTAVSIRFTASQVFGEELASLLWEDVPTLKDGKNYIENY